tara:strand:- start:3224 stop:3403 length:180 start_codon:yes stop_codon:yes gene_type:complete
MDLQKATLYVSTISTVVLAVCFFLLFSAMEAELAQDVIENDNLAIIMEGVKACGNHSGS